MDAALINRTPIVIGILHSRTGPMAVSESSMIASEILALEEINQSGATFLMTTPLRLAPDAAFRLEIPFGNAQVGAAVQRGSTGDRR